jgi:2-polyprenyl-3-methyl-5-hydroxy-6-metoxy-1,4-benzoquinol methylase
MDLREAGGGELRSRHPWETARANLVVRTIRALPGPDSCELDILDFGAGDCFIASRIAEALPRASVICFDPAYRPEDFRRIGTALPDSIRMTASRPPSAHPVVLMLDVLEHVADDGELLHSVVAEHLRPGGYLLMSVPALPALFSGHDHRLGHFRRYSRAGLLGLVRATGLEVVTAGGIFCSLVVPRAIQGLAERASATRGRVLAQDGPFSRWGASVAGWRQPPAVTRALSWWLTYEVIAEAYLANHGFAVTGLSHWVVARKGK